MLAELRTITDPRAGKTAEELVRLLLELYGGGLERMMEIVDEEPRRRRAVRPLRRR